MTKPYVQRAKVVGVERHAILRPPNTVRCDVEGCGAETYVERYRGDAAEKAREKAATKGWGFVDGLDLCPEHFAARNRSSNNERPRPVKPRALRALTSGRETARNPTPSTSAIYHPPPPMGTGFALVGRGKSDTVQPWKRARHTTDSGPFSGRLTVGFRALNAAIGVRCPSREPAHERRPNRPRRSVAGRALRTAERGFDSSRGLHPKTSP